MIGASLSFLDSTVVNVALRTLSADLHTSLSEVQWVVTGYLLALAAVIPVTGWAARRAGAARLYVAALAVFTVGSALCACSQSAGMLIACRVLQGAGGGAILPAGTMIWTSQATRAQMARVMSVIGVPIVLAPMLGPTIGGLLIEGLGWRAIFWLNVPLGAAGVALAARLLPGGGGTGAGRLDVTGLILGAGGTVGVTYGLAEAGATSGLGTAAAVPLITGLVLLGGFVVHARRPGRPLLDVSLYASRAFAAASVASFALGAAMFGGMILLPLYFQIVRGENVILTGLLLVPSGAGAVISNRLAAPLTDRYGAGVTAFAGAALGMVSTVPFVFLTAGTSYALLALVMVARGAGTGLSVVPVMTAAYRALPPGKIPDAAPQLNVLQRIGGAMGTAVLTVVLQDQLRQHTSSAGAARGFGVTFVWVLAIATAAAIPTVVLARTEWRDRDTQPATVKEDTGADAAH